MQTVRSNSKVYALTPNAMKLLNTAKKGKLSSIIKESQTDNLFEIGRTPLRGSNVSVKSKNVNNN